MFERKTVFILGAGASWHYNYPTGDDLVGCVLEKLRILIGCYEGDWKRSNRDLNDSLRAGPLGRIDAVCKIIGNDSVENPEVVKYLENFYERLKFVNPPVIDYFFQSNADLQEIGKLLIAWVMLDRETEYSKFFLNVNRTRIGQKPRDHKDDWYRYVLYKMLLGAESYEDVFKNNLDFITFNYDVSLDTYLYKGLKQIEFMKSDRVLDENIKGNLKDRIHHVYGYVREDDQFSDLSMSYAPPDSKTVAEYDHIVEGAYRASQSIDTIAGKKREIPEGILKKIEEAQDIYILGFGFDAVNCEGLNASDYFGFNSSKQYIADTDYRNLFFTNYGDHKSVTKKVHKVCKFPNEGVFFSSWGDKPYKYYGSLGGEGRGSGGVRYEMSTKNVYEAISQDFNLI